jgi:hypothetical protein
VCKRWGSQDYKNLIEKRTWNPNVPIGEAWREDLYHKLMSKN